MTKLCLLTSSQASPEQVISDSRRLLALVLGLSQCLLLVSLHFMLLAPLTYSVFTRVGNGVMFLQEKLSTSDLQGRCSVNTPLADSLVRGL